ncbi:MAG: CPBP family intramembrane metalloprotease, partial [Clostridia bacterium]|nr:CPBP family intramembrane metalloprotease [Clostridia bacterium]
QSWEVIMSMIFQCFSVGVVEEIYFRGILFNVIDDYFGHKNACDVWKPVVLSGFLFGFCHLSIFGGMSGFLSTLSQSIACIGIGIFFGAVYMRCRNIYSLMFIHALHDIVAAYHTFIVHNNLVESRSSQDFNWIGRIIQLIAFILIAMFILRKKKMAEIINSEPNKSSLDPKYS